MRCGQPGEAGFQRRKPRSEKGDNDVIWNSMVFDSQRGLDSSHARVSQRSARGYQLHPGELQ